MDWSAGEIGYMLVPGTSVKPVERGEPGALEDIVGAKVLRRSGRVPARRPYAASERTGCYRNIRSCAAGDVLARSVLSKSAQTLLMPSITSRWFSTAAFCARWQRRHAPGVLESNQRFLSCGISGCNRSWYAVRWGLNAQVNGAICLAIETALSRVLSS